MDKIRNDEIDKLIFDLLSSTIEEDEEFLHRLISLLKRNVDINYQDENTSSTYVMASISNNLPKSFQIIIGLNPDLSLTNNLGQTALHVASSHPNSFFLKSLLAQKAYIDAADIWQNRPINNAIKAEIIPNIKELIDANATLNLLNIYGNSIYDDAISTKNNELIDFLNNYQPKKSKKPKGRIREILFSKYKK